MDLNSVDHILWQLKLLTKHAGSLDNASTALREPQFELIEHLLLAIVRVRDFDAAVKHGLQLVQMFGHRARLCTCVILGLCHTARYKECYKFLERWGQADPNNSALLSCKQVIEGFLLVVGSGTDPSLIMDDLEEALGLREGAEKKLLSASSSMTNLTKESSPSPSFLGVGAISPSPSQSQAQIKAAISQHYAHNPYLTKLHKQINSSNDVSKLLVEKLDGVKIKCFTEVDAVVRGTDHRWAFAINSRDAMRTVSLLHDNGRENFAITGAYFYHADNKTCNLLDIHTTNAIPNLQVLNTFVPADMLRELGGWPSCFTYKIEIRFKGFSPGKFKQTIVFDFKKEPKVVRHISAEFHSVPTSTLASSSMVAIASTSGSSTPVSVGPSAFIPYREKEHISMPMQLSPPALSSSTSSFNSLALAPLLIAPISAAAPSQPEWHKNTGPTLLHRSNYCSAQERIINCEMQFLQTHLKQNSMIQTMKLSKSYIMEKKFGNEMKLADEGEMFLVMQIESSTFKDTIFGKLVSQHCSCVLISHTANSTHSYTCKVKEKMEDKWVITVDFNQVLELGLRLDQAFQFKIEFILDISHFAELTRLIGLISDVELQILFPDVTRRIDFAVDAFDGTLQEGLFSLNPRQVDAFNVITKLPLTMAYLPPVLLIGPPGSGKTHTLTESIKKILMSQPTSRLLICTQSNSEANKYVETFDEWIKSGLKAKMIRVYDPEKNSLEDIPSVAKRYCTLTLDFNLRSPTKEEIQQVNIVVTTINTTSILSKFDIVDLGKYYFSHIIVDEAGNQLEVDLIAPIFLANPNTRVIFSGDQNSYNQLSSVSSNILERLNLHYPDGHLCKIILNENYQNHADILKFVSDHFSPVKLRCSSILSSHPKYSPLTYFTVKGGEAKSRASFYNVSEVLEIGKFIQSLVSSWPSQWGRYQEPNSIAVFTNYEDQISHLRAQLRSVGLGFVAVEGIWNLRANWFRVVILSTVRSYNSSSPVVDDSGFFNNDRLIYNALTRAQSLFAVFGDPSLCAFGLSCDIWKAFISAAALSETSRPPEPNCKFGAAASVLARSLQRDDSQSTFQLFPKNSHPPGFPQVAQASPICRPTPIAPPQLTRPLQLKLGLGGGASEDFAFSKFLQAGADADGAGRVTPFLDMLQLQSKIGESLLAQLNGRGIGFAIGNINDRPPGGGGGLFTPPPRPSSTGGTNHGNQNQNHRMNSLPPRLREKSNRSRNRKGGSGGGNEGKRSGGCGSGGGNGNSNGNGKRNESAANKKSAGANLNEIIMESVANKLDNMALNSQAKQQQSQNNSAQDKDKDKDKGSSEAQPNYDWVEVKKTKKSKRGNRKAANGNSAAGAMEEASTQEEKVKCLVNMGYEKRRATKALQHADKDLAKAIEHLISSSSPGKKKSTVKSDTDGN